MESSSAEAAKALPQKRTKEEWQTLINQWQTSHLSQQQFCQGRGINVNTFNYWKRRLINGQKPARSVGKSNGSEFVKVTTPETPAVDLCLSLPNGCRLSWRGEVCPGYLNTLLSALIS